jgi:hypothetical protein
MRTSDSAPLSFPVVRSRAARGASLILGLCCVLGTACADRGAAVITGPPSVAANGVAAFVAISSSALLQGDIIVVSANVRVGSTAPRVGSYLARLAFDPEQLEFIDEVPVAGGIHAMHAAGTELRVAGAAVDGITGERLFAARFRVRGGRPLAALALDVKELNDVSYGDRLPTLRRHRSVFLEELPQP